MVTTILTAIVGTLVMGLYANRPFAVAPYMGENAFIAFTVVKVLGYRWQTAMATVFLAGVMFTLLTVARVRAWIVEALPPRPELQLRRGNRIVPDLHRTQRIRDSRDWRARRSGKTRESRDAFG
ncbi:solute carrier family 23 protein [Candidatus Binatus sp.]|uniref:solute carrier family 23 protein n=1 Tax=Candidatus Binatus sp. TaxID=2811406 RepID=UPI003BB007DF